MPLTDIAIRNVKPSDKAKKMFDGGGLYLEVAPSGGDSSTALGARRKDCL